MSTISERADSYYYDAATDTLIPLVAPPGKPGLDAPRIYADMAARDAASPPPPGTLCVTLAEDAVWMRGATEWSLVYGNTYAHYAKATAGTTAPSAIWTTTTWTIVKDALGLMTLDTEVVIPPGFGGRWFMQASVEMGPPYPATPGARRGIQFKVNGATTYGIVVNKAPPANTGGTVAASATLSLVPGDSVTVEVFQETGGVVNLYGSGMHWSAYHMGLGGPLT